MIMLVNTHEDKIKDLEDNFEQCLDLFHSFIEKNASSDDPQQTAYDFVREIFLHAHEAGFKRCANNIQQELREMRNKK